MNRTTTNFIRFLMDECLPPIIRDSRWFMYPFFYFWFKGKNLKLYMDFKSLVYTMTPEEYADAYRNLDSRATDRVADFNDATLKGILDAIEDSDKSVLDVGCGRGYLLEQIAQTKPHVARTGCDVYETVDIPDGAYRQGVITKLPFEDNSFDVVTATCILEHIVDLDKAVNELKRVARKKVIIAVPRQRYYYYTLDMHVHFFPLKTDVERMMKMPAHMCDDKGGDWLYIGKKL